ncbi:MAG: cupin domain-containing protein, partial [Kofleriaceae bacterium]
TGRRVAERAELWYFLNPARVDGKSVAAGDMMFVPAQAARDVAAVTDLHAVLVLVPGGPEGSIRAGALPTRELGAIKTGIAGPVMLPASAAKQYCVGRGAQPKCDPTETTIQLFAETKQLGASVLAMRAEGRVPEHVHAGETELLYVLSGTGVMTVNGVKLAVSATTVVQIPANTKHSFEATADLRAIQIYTPGGPEQRFKAKP